MAEAPFDAIPSAANFADYFTTTWLESTVFSIQLWNHWEAGDRTTNAAEGWHSKIKDTVNHAHPDVYSAVEIIKREQDTTELCILQLANGAAPPAKKRKYTTQENRLQRLRTNFQTNAITLCQYVDAVGNLFMV